MKRIQLIIGMLVLFGITGSVTVLAKPARKTEKFIGLQLYSLREDIKKDFDKTISTVGNMGYKFIEAANYDEGKFYGFSPDVFKSKIDAAGLIFLSSHTGKSLPVEKMDKINWDEIWKWWDTCIDAHKTAGAKYIIAPSMPKDIKNLDILKSYCDYYNKIGEKCKAKGLKFGYHNHSFEFVKIEGEMMYDYMIQHTDPKLVFFQMDVYWVVKGGESPVEYFEKYPGRFEVLHIKDHKELGESGMVGFDAIFKHIQTAGTKYLVVEVEKYNFKPVESVKKSLEYLQKAAFVKANYSD